MRPMKYENRLVSFRFIEILANTEFVGPVKMSNFMFDELTVDKSEIVKLFLMRFKNYFAKTLVNIFTFKVNLLNSRKTVHLQVQKIRIQFGKFTFSMSGFAKLKKSMFAKI